jgi:hypothetical protein
MARHANPATVTRLNIPINAVIRVGESIPTAHKKAPPAANLRCPVTAALSIKEKDEHAY